MSIDADKVKSRYVLDDDIWPVSSGFCAISGRLDFNQANTDNSGVPLEYRYPNDHRPSMPKTETGCIQTLKRAQDIELPRPRQLLTAVTFAGSIWKVPLLPQNDNPIESCSVVLERSLYGDRDAHTELQGDYVCAVLTSNGVMLMKSAGANRSLYYRVDHTKQYIIWSTNYVDVASDPIADLSVSRLAAFGWGCDSMPYPEVQAINDGEQVHVYSDASERTLLIERVTHKQSIKSYFSRPKQRKSLSAWAEATRTILMKATTDRASPFDKVGVLLSGGIDSAAIARCLKDGGIETVCYHVSHRSYAFADERKYAKAVCKQLDLPLRTIDVSAQRLPGGDYLNTARKFVVPYNHPHFAFWDAVVKLIDGEVNVLFTGHGGHLFSGSERYDFLSSVFKSRVLELPWTIMNGLSVIASRDSSLLNYRSMSREMAVQARRGVLTPDTGSFIYTDHAQRHIARLFSASLEQHSGDLQMTSINVNVLEPHGIVHLTPYTDPDVGRFLEEIPKDDIPFQGKMYSKPVLNLAFVGLLPPKVIRRQGNPALTAMTRSYCVNNIKTIKQILHSESRLVQLGIIDYERLSQVLLDKKSLELHAPRLITACLATLWLEALSNERNAL